MKNPVNAARLMVVTAMVLGACSPDATRPADPSFQSFAGAAWSPPVWLGPIVNSAARDMGPTLAPDGLSLYFNSERDGGFGGMDLWVARRACEACDWAAPVNLGGTVNGDAQDEGAELSADGHLLFFSSVRPGGHGGADLYVAARTDPTDDLGWGIPVNLGPDINSADHDHQPAVASTGDGTLQLYFVRGSADIYMVPIQVARRGTEAPVVTARGAPTPVSELNLPGQQTWSPTIRADGRELFFWSGPGRGGLGGADIWTATRQSPVHPWNVPVPLGGPVNTVFADLEASISRDGRTLVFASAQQRGGLGRQDLWMATRTPGGKP